jgi:hypothetical protein
MTASMTNSTQYFGPFFAIVTGLSCLTVAAADGHAEAAVYRCVVDGRAVYSDRQCGSQATKVEIEPSAITKPTDAQMLQSESNLGHVLVGMTTTQTELAWGRPREIISESDGSGSVQRWIYARSEEVVTVHFAEGKVAKIASVKTLSPPPAIAAAPTSGQLTLSELEARERDEKAGERRFARIGMVQEEVRGKLGPPSDRQVRNTLMGVGDCWTYQAAPRDPETETTICFSVDYLRAMSVDRVVRR